MAKYSLEENISQLEVLICQNEIHHEPVIKILQQLTILMRSSETRSDLSNDLWSPITKLAMVCQQILSKNDPSMDELELLTELLRFLRNCCGGSYSNQYFILNHQDVINFAKQTLMLFLQKETPKESLILKICVQLFGNILASNEDSKPVIWSLFFGENVFRFLLQHKDMSIRECCMMVLFNCMSDEICKCVYNSKEGLEILIQVTNTLLLNHIDWGMLFIEYLLKQEEFLNCYDVLPFKNRILVLDIMAEVLKSSQDDGIFFIPCASIEIIKNIFLKYVIQLYNSKGSEKEPAETVTMLSILCSASVSDAYIFTLQNSKDLIAISIESLKCIHLLGKEGSNLFSSLSGVDQMSFKFNEEIADHPLYGFKKNLIRLIGNLCCNCRDNQDLVRNLDGIPLVLDCCKFDAKNPYITQWCILAIRNMLENNAENQDILAGMSVSGEIVDSKYLNEMGFQVHSEDGKFRIRSMPS